MVEEVHGGDSGGCANCKEKFEDRSSRFSQLREGHDTMNGLNCVYKLIY
jgi:hypothetical protein